MREKDWTFLPFDRALTPPAGLIEHLKNRWWVVHPDKGLLFYKDSPQCNSDDQIARRLLDLSKHPDLEVRFLPSAFHKINPADYC